MLDHFAVEGYNVDNKIRSLKRFIIKNKGLETAEWLIKEYEDQLNIAFLLGCFCYFFFSFIYNSSYF